LYQALYYCNEEKQYYLRDDRNDSFKTIKYWPTYFLPDEDGEHLTLEGTRVSPVRRIDDWRDTRYFEKDVDKITRFLVDHYYETDDTPKTHNIIYLDIECVVAGALTEENIKDPKGEITAIALYDHNTKKYFCLVLDKSNKMSKAESEGKIIMPFSSEKELLSGFLDKWYELDPTIITGWNSGFFDIPYLYYRIKKVLGETVANTLSPIGKIKFTPQFPEQPVNLAGINHLDYMLLFKKYIMKQEPSYRLGDIGKKYAKLEKIEYQGSLDKLFAEDVDKYIEYNLRDVEIIVELENRMKFIDLTVTIAHLCHTEYEAIYFSTMLNEGAILTYLKRKGIISPNKPTTYNPSLRTLEEEYAGGYLLDPKPGLYRWIIDDDYSSLYPSIIRSLNLGIETYVGRILDRIIKEDCWWGLDDLKKMNPERIISIENKKQKQTTIKVSELIKMIEDNNFTISASGAMFRTDKQSVVCEILADWFAKRQDYKKMMKQAYMSGDKTKGDFYNSRQHSYKILLNSVYGVFAINSWRYTDGRKILSSAITLTGQRMIKETIKQANEIMEELLK
jgi:DNA polymerase elongation subunit (family B)